MRRSRGFTLFEIMTVVAILLISLSLTYPTMIGFFDRMHLQTNMQQIHRLLNFTRSSAIQSGQSVTLCPLDRTDSCLAPGADWQGQLAVFIDRNNNQALDPNETKLRVYDLKTPRASVRWRAFSGLNIARFSPLGLSTVSNGTLTLCLPAQHFQYRLIMNRQGRVREDTRNVSNPRNC